jgi:hypothetical protein
MSGLAIRILAVLSEGFVKLKLSFGRLPVLCVRQSQPQIAVPLIEKQRGVRRPVSSMVLDLESYHELVPFGKASLQADKLSPNCFRST